MGNEVSRILKGWAKTGRNGQATMMFGEKQGGRMDGEAREARERGEFVGRNNVSIKTEPIETKVKANARSSSLLLH